MTGNQVALVVTCGGVIFSVMVAILGVLVRIASGWSALRHEMGDLKEDFKVLVDNKFNERLMRVEFIVEEVRNAIRSPEGGGGGQVGSRQQGQRRRQS